MNTEYESLNLDGLLELSRSDAEHAGDMAEQARVLREMSRDLKDNVDLMRGVMETLFPQQEGENAPWSGESAKMMKTELDRLYKPASSAPEVLEQDAKAMDDFSTKVHNTLVEIDRLHVQSKGHGGDSGGEEADIKKARQIMQTANSGYLSSATSMPEPEFYNGLRKSADDAPDGGWTEQHGATPAGDAPPPVPASTTGPQSGSDPAQPVGQQPGQPWSPPPSQTDPSEPVLQGPAPTGPGPAAPPPAAPPAPPAAPPVTVVPPTPGPRMPPMTGRPPVAPPPLRPGPIPIRPVTTIPTPNPLAPRPTNTVPPVIGRPRPSVMPPMTPRPVVPNPNGTVPPVIGSRPGTTGMPLPGRPIIPNPNGTVPPVIGTRPGPMGVPMTGRPVMSGPNGTVPPVIGGRTGPGMVPFSTRPGPMGPNGTVPPGAGPRSGVGMVPPPGRSLTSTGMVPPPGGARTGMGGVPSSKKTGKSKPGQPPRSGAADSSDLVPDRYTNARPAGGLAFSGQSRPTPIPPAQAPAVRQSTPGESLTSGRPEAKAAATKPAGQRVKRMPRQGGQAVEHAIVRGAQRKPLSRSPGQEVFAKFDAVAKAAAEEEKKPKREIDPDSDWAIRRISVPAVITTRKAD